MKRRIALLLALGVLAAGLTPDAVVRGDMLFTGGVTGFDAKGEREPRNEDQAARIGALVSSSRSC